MNEGSGKFGKHADFATGLAPFAVATGDFRGDGNIDVVTANGGVDTVSVLLGNGNGTLQPQTQIAAGVIPFDVATADLNGDGKLDMVVVNQLSNNVSVMLGNGNGTFQTQVDYAAGGSPEWVAISDFNGDGIPDLAVVDCPTSYAGGISVLIGNGNGTFQPAVYYNTGYCGAGIAAGDFNQDGIQDLAAVNYDENTVSVLLGNGDGTFQPQVTYPSGIIPVSIVVGDFNNDGYLDLATSNDNCAYYSSDCPPGTVSILFGNGDGTFQPNVDYRVGILPEALATADLDLNGAAGLAVPNTFSNTVSVYLNRPVIGIFPNSLNFGKETVGVKSSALTIAIGNPSGTPITITGKPKISGADATDFAETTTCPLSPTPFAAGAQCSISVTFDPKATGREALRSA